MPINNCPFTKFSAKNGPPIYRAVLFIKIINPHTGLHFSTYGIIDTGADECAVPAPIAKTIGHNLKAGTTRTNITGNGETTSYKHTTVIEMYHPKTGALMYRVKDTPIDYMPKLPVVLLGVNNFLSGFNLNINYPKRIFSIKK